MDRVIKATLLLVCFVVSGWGSEKKYPQATEIKYPHINTRLGTGITINPQTFLMMGSFEAQLDPFLSVGPRISIGLGSTVDLIQPTMGVRFVLPFSTVKSSWHAPDMELSVYGGFGTLFRNADGARFRHLVFELGTSVDVYVARHLTVGVGGSANITNSSVEASYGSLCAQAMYHF